MPTKHIKKILEFHNIDAEIIEIDFKAYATLPRDINGVYILKGEKDLIMYVGKGNIYDRQRKHWPKAYGDFGIKDPEGWRWLFENRNSSPEKWKLIYIPLYKQTELSAVEGSLIHKLQPLANNEVYVDNERSL